MAAVSSTARCAADDAVALVTSADPRAGTYKTMGRIGSRAPQNFQQQSQVLHGCGCVVVIVIGAGGSGDGAELLLKFYSLFARDEDADSVGDVCRMYRCHDRHRH